MALLVMAGSMVVVGAGAARADVKDSWVTTKAKISLLTSDGFSVNGANVDAIAVASVNNGVVLLSGKTKSVYENLGAIENAYSVNGVRRVASEIQIRKE